MIEVFWDKETHIVYDSFDEARELVIKPLLTIKVGEYYRFSNGYYAQLLSKKDIVRKHNGNTLIYQAYQFPATLLYASEKTHHKAYKYQPRDLNVATGLKPPDFAFIELVANGMNVFEAGKRAYKQTSMTIIFAKLANAEIIKKIVMRVNMKTIGQHLNNQGITEESLAVIVANLIKEPDTNATLKKWALEFSIKALGEQPSTTAGSQALQDASAALDSLMNN